MSKLIQYWKKLWKLFWKDDSIWSWLVNIIIAFLVIRYVVYPVLGIVLGTGFPIVAVVSESMEHGTHNDVLCGQQFDTFHESFNAYWTVCGDWYEQNGISKADFLQFPFNNGFDKGDVIILWRANRDNTEVGDVLVFQGTKPQPIIHRVVRVWEEDGEQFYQTKGDHNSGSIQGGFGETKIAQERVFGQGILRVPYLGWMKILFVDAVKPLGITIER